MRGNMRIYLLIATIVATVIIIDTAMALPEMLDSFNIKYNTKGTRLDTCDLCHISGKPQRSTCDEVCHIPNKPQKVDPVNLNQYGVNLKAHLDKPTDQAFVAIEKIDSAGDKIPNIDKIRNLTFPGDKKDNKKDNNLTDTKGNKNLFSGLVDILNNSSNRIILKWDDLI